MEVFVIFTGLQCRIRCKKANPDVHIEGLDGLRTLAIVGVTLFHLFPQVFQGGYLGVSLFFVLTGYLLAYTSERNCQKEPFPILSYYRKRIKRIYPSLLIVMLVTVGCYSFLAPNVITAIRPEMFSVLLGYNNWWQIAQNADYFTRLLNQSPFTHLWFLGIELQYYLIWPLLYFLYTGISYFYGKRTGVVSMAFCGLFFATLMPIFYQDGLDITRLYYGTDMRIYALLLGAAIGFFQVHFSFSLSGRFWNLATAKFLFGATLAVTIAGYFLLNGQLPGTYEGGMVLYTFLFCLMLALTTDKELPMGNLMEHPVLRWIGTYSYGIFLWQYPVIFLFQYRQWGNVIPYLMPFLELGLIVVLAFWTELLIRSLPVLRQLSLRPRRIAIQLLVVMLISLPGITLMGYGCKGVWESASVKASDTDELKARFAENEKALEQQPLEDGPIDYTNNPALRNIACIGDSVMLGSAMEIKKVLPDCYIDAKVSRYVGSGKAVAQKIASQGRLGHTVLVALGTNGPLDGQYEEQTKEFLDYLGSDRQIFWVNVYCPATGWQDSNNAYLEEIAATHDNVVLIDWCSLVKQHPEWLSGDGIHPNDEGTVAYADLIAKTIARKTQSATQ